MELFICDKAKECENKDCEHILEHEKNDDCDVWCNLLEANCVLTAPIEPRKGTQKARVLEILRRAAKRGERTVGDYVTQPGYVTNYALMVHTHIPDPGRMVRYLRADGHNIDKKIITYKSDGEAKWCGTYKLIEEKK